MSIANVIEKNPRFERAMQRRAELKADRAPYEPEWREIARLFAPEQQNIGGQNVQHNVASGIFDSTALYAGENFSGGLFGQATNPANRWFGAITDDMGLVNWKPAKDWFWQVSNIIYRSITPHYSMFYAEIPIVFGDMGKFGIGALYQEEDKKNFRFNDRAIPLAECYVDFDAFGMLHTFMREFKLKGRMLKKRWPELEADHYKVTDTREYCVCHLVDPNENMKPGRIGPAGMPWASMHFSPDIPQWERTGGYEEMPYHVGQWTRSSGRKYPTGPGHLARPDNATLQESVRSQLVAEQFAAEPPTMVSEEADLVAADIVPNAVLYGAIAENGKALVQTMNRAQNLSLSMEGNKQRREQIKQAFYFGLFQLVNRPQMTATEFLGFQEENLRLMGPHLSRIQSHLLSPFLSRRFKLLERAGLLPPAPEELKDRAITFVYESPLAKLQKVGQARGDMQYVNALLQYAQADPTVLDNIDGDEYARSLHEGFSTTPALLRDPKKVEERRQQRLAQMAQQQQLDQAGQAVTIAAEASHAAQASSAARQRTQP